MYCESEHGFSQMINKEKKGSKIDRLQILFLAHLKRKVYIYQIADIRKQRVANNSIFYKKGSI